MIHLLPPVNFVGAFGLNNAKFCPGEILLPAWFCLSRASTKTAAWHVFISIHQFHQGLIWTLITNGFPGLIMVLSDLLSSKFEASVYDLHCPVIQNHIILISFSVVNKLNSNCNPHPLLPSILKNRSHIEPCCYQSPYSGPGWSMPELDPWPLHCKP